MTERDHIRFRWSLFVWLLGFAFVWAILILELVNALWGAIRHAFGPAGPLAGNISPVETCGTPSTALNSIAAVPFPEPGGPRKTIRW